MAYYVEASAFSGRVNEIENLLNNTNISSELAMLNSPSGKISLKQARENAYKNVSNFLSILGYDPEPATGMAQLNAAIQRFHSTTTAFNGVELRAKVIEPLRGKTIDMASLEQKKFETLVAEHSKQASIIFMELLENIMNEMDFSDDLKVSEIRELVIQELEAELGSLSVIIDLSSSSITTVGSQKSNSEQIKFTIEEKTRKMILKSFVEGYTRLGPLFKTKGGAEFKKAVLKLAQSRGIAIDWLIQDEIPLPEISTATTNDSFQLYYDFIGPYMEKMTPINGTVAEKSAREYFEKHPEEVASLYADAESYFMQFLNVGGLTGGEQTHLLDAFRKALHSILDNYPAAFFTGRNDNAIIGIFGELQGMYYLYAILGENTTLSAPEISWIGGDTTAGSGAKTGADLIVQIGEQLGFGIQVKNSMELTKSTGFSDFVLSGDSINNVGGFMSQMINLGIDPAIIESIEEIMTMKSFNIGYRMRGNHAVAGTPLSIQGTDIYQTAYDKLDDLIDKANRLMALAAAAIMRIQYAEGMDFQENNTLWLIGGTAMISSIQVLDDLIRQIDAIDTNRLVASVATKLGDKNYTIVDYINGAGGISNLKTVLKTSYNFHKVSSL